MLMKYRLKSMLIKNLKKLDDVLVEGPILIPKPKGSFQNRKKRCFYFDT